MQLRIPPIVDDNPVTRTLPIPVRRTIEAWIDNFNAVLSVENPRVMSRMAPSAARGLFLRKGRSGEPTQLRSKHRAFLDFEYPDDQPEMRRLYEKAKRLQWNGATDLDWSTDVDPMNPEVPLLSRDFFDWDVMRAGGARLDARFQQCLIRDTASWMLSQFLHGEQGALMAAAQVTESVPYFSGKLYGATQVVDEARHVEVFLRYLDDKLTKRYDINDNLFTIIDSLMTDGRWDMKFLGMQILVEGLALGAFGTLYRMTSEPLLKELLRRVIQDEARHVRYGILSLRDLYTKKLSERERIEREDYAFEIVLLMRNRFLAHEIYDEHYSHLITRRQWNEIINHSPGMQVFRRVMFSRLVPNLRAIGLLTKRVMHRYERVGLGQYFGMPSTDQLKDEQLLTGEGA